MEAGLAFDIRFTAGPNRGGAPVSGPTRRIRRSSPKGACQALRADGCADLIAPGGVAPGIQMVYLLSLSGSEMAGLLRKQAHALAGKLGNLLVIGSP